MSIDTPRDDAPELDWRPYENPHFTHGHLIADHQGTVAVVSARGGMMIPGQTFRADSLEDAKQIARDALTRRTDQPARVVKPLDDRSLSARVSEIGNQIHNIACEHQSDESLTERLGELRSQLWEIARLLPTGAQS